MIVTLGKTNATQNVYFAEFFSLQGVVRELWVKECVQNSVQYFSQGLLISTKSAHCDFKKPFYCFDTILCRMHIEELQRVSAKLVFEFCHDQTQECHVTGWQVVVFKDQQRRTCRMPDDFRQAAHAILWPDECILETPRT